MDKDAGLIGVETVEEHEDGSATYTFHMDAHARGLLAEEGLRLVLYCAAAKMDMQLVYDFIEDHIRYERDESTPDIRPMTPEERQQAKKRSEMNKIDKKDQNNSKSEGKT